MHDYSMTEKLIETGIQQGVFRKDVHIDIFNRALHALFDLFGQDSQIIAEGYPRKDMFNHIIIPFFRGISTEKGQQLLEDCKSILE
jgi:hypothetical protein